eukprot:214052-Lingulodinium_polyedra.AAC.1
MHDAYATCPSLAFAQWPTHEHLKSIVNTCVGSTTLQHKSDSPLRSPPELERPMTALPSEAETRCL